MKREDMKEMVREHFDSSKPVNTEELLVNLRPVISHKCEQIRMQKKSSSEGIIFVVFCVICIFAGTFILFPNYVSYSDEIFQFLSLGIMIGFVSLMVGLLVKSLLSIDSTDRKIELRGKLS
jgi:hypothetical protein